MKTGSDLSRDFNGDLAIAAAAFMPDVMTGVLLEYNVLPMTGTIDSKRAMMAVSRKSNRLRRNAVLKRSKPKTTNLDTSHQSSYQICITNYLTGTHYCRSDQHLSLCAALAGL
jgi:hypothetical protein